MKHLGKKQRIKIFNELKDVLSRIADINLRSTVFMQENIGSEIKLDPETLQIASHRFSIYSQEDISSLKLSLYEIDPSEHKELYFSEIDQKIAPWCNVKHLGILYKKTRK